MEKQLFTEDHLNRLRDLYAQLDTVQPDSFNEGMENIFKQMNNDQVCQLARAGVKFVSVAAYFEAKKRGITIEGWRAAI